MKIDVLSDLHIDNWQNTLRGLNDANIDFFIESYIKPQSDYIVIAGDLGNRASSSLYILSMLKKHYKRIIVTLGNHDFYRTSDSEKKLFKTYKDKYNYLKEEIPKLGIDLLDGNVVEIDGVKFGGACGWYDFKYTAQKREYLTDYIIYKNFVDFMSDSWAVFDIDRTQELDVVLVKALNENLFNAEYKKLEKVIKKCDVMVTHINPTIEESSINPKWRNDMLTNCFCFDGSKLLKKTTAKTWIYGHTHESYDYQYENVYLACNPLGYPFENHKTTAIQLEV